MTSRPYAEVIGDPIAHSKSPLIHNFWLNRLGIDADYRFSHVAADDLTAYFAQKRDDVGWRGCNVTIPHKVSVSAFADIIDKRADAIGASNCLWRDTAGHLVATNTDVDGVKTAIGPLDLVDADVSVLGAGGAARAAFHALIGTGCSLHVLARDPEKAVSVSSAAGYTSKGVLLKPGSNALRNARLLINATQLGMTGQAPMPSYVLTDLAGMAPGAMVFDMVYAPIETALLRAARHCGLATVDGLDMLIAQAASAFALFFGQPAPRQHDAELRGRLLA